MTEAQPTFDANKLVDAARKALQEIKAAGLNPIELREFFKKVGNFLGTVQDENSWGTATDALIDRLTSRNDNLADSFTELALERSTPARLKVLTERFKLGGNNIFHAIDDILANIAGDAREIMSGDLHGMGDDGGNNSESSGGWRDSLKNDKRQDIPNLDISSSAREFDESFGGSDENDIRHSANGDNSYKDGSTPKNEFEKIEGKDNNFLENMGDQREKARRFRETFSAIRKIFFDNLEPALPKQAAGLSKSA